MTNAELACSLLLAAMFLGFCVPGLTYVAFREPPKRDPHPTHDTTKTRVVR